MCVNLISPGQIRDYVLLIPPLMNFDQIHSLVLLNLWLIENIWLQTKVKMMLHCFCNTYYSSIQNLHTRLEPCKLKIRLKID